MATTNNHTVVKGDTMASIAAKYETTARAILELNYMTDKDPTTITLVVGQKLRVSGSKISKPSVGSTPTIRWFGEVSNPDSDDLYCEWNLSDGILKYTNYYELYVYYDGATEPETLTYTLPPDADVRSAMTEAEAKAQLLEYRGDCKHYQFAPRAGWKSAKLSLKPFSDVKKYDSKTGKAKEWYFTGQKATAVTCYWRDVAPTKPNAPTLSLDKLALTVSNNDLDVSATQIKYTLISGKTNEEHAISSVVVPVDKTTHSSETVFNLTAGVRYKIYTYLGARDMWSNDLVDSGWIDTPPSQPNDADIKIEAATISSVRVSWAKLDTAEGYEIEYATKREYFDVTSDTSTVTIEKDKTSWTITGMTSGSDYYFRLRGTNDNAGNGEWSGIFHVALGKKPEAPSTWSSASTAIIGDTVTLYWTHNPKDDSTQKYVRICYKINDGEEQYESIDTSNIPEGDDIPSKWSLALTSDIVSNGSILKYKVQTAGATAESITDYDNFSPWSIERQINVYSKPSITASYVDSDGEVIDQYIKNYPIYLSTSSPSPIGFSLTVISNAAYDVTDNTGVRKHIKAGEEIFTKTFNQTTDIESYAITPENIYLENNIEYSFEVNAELASGLQATTSTIFTIAYEAVEDTYYPNASILYNSDSMTMSITPFVLDDNEEYLTSKTLAVYRIDMDNSLVEIGSGLSNNGYTTVIDPHPPFGYAQYRIISQDKTTGQIAFSDLDGVEVPEKAIVIQWSEEWSDYDPESGNDANSTIWNGQMLKLPYNIEITDKAEPDVAFANYIGRKHPVSYYGTSLGQKAEWAAAYDKEDTDTSTMLRKLQTWMGDCYVRNPAGVGYWANVGIKQIQEKYDELTAKVTLEITRVEGGK